MSGISIRLQCPKCRLDASAMLDSKRKFIIYTCPRCKSNVIHYKQKTEIISDRLFHKLLRKGRLVFCGDVRFPVKPENIEGTLISSDDLINLKILLETEKDSATFLSRI